MKLHMLANRLVMACLAIFSAVALAQTSVPTFDPVRDDTDIFMTNPSINSERPNILIVLDNTANWNNMFANEKSALVSVVNGLNEFFNVGFAMYVETGGGNDNEDGAYVRFGVRQMLGTNRNNLSSMVNGLHILNDKSNNNTIALAMSEVYRYYKGATSYSSYGKVKTDYAGNTTNNPLAANLPGNAFASAPNSTTPFFSPVSDACQKNFVIYIGNGKFNENAAALSTAKTRLKTAMGITTDPAQLVISPSGDQGNWADEWAQYMAYTGFDTTISGQTKRAYVTTYTIAVDPTATAWNADSIALMQSMATHGKGKYFGVSSAGGAQALIDALNQIFNEIQAVNSVFASTTLPVSVNVRGTNLNQVYIGMFRPDAAKAPRWHGNLKLYKLKLDTAGHLVLGDANAVIAEDPNTGFITNSATSFWTHNSSFWNYRTAEENGTGGGSDSPDGDLVEKGAVGQRLREAYATSQASRNLYTCTTGGTTHPACTGCSIGGSGTAKTCTSGSLLSATPFVTGNDAISTASLALGTKDVSPLTAKVTKAVASIVDRRTVALNNTAGGFAVGVTSLNNGAVTVPVAVLNSNLTKNITSLSALVTYTPRTISAASCVQVGGSGGSKQWSCSITTTLAHSVASGDSVTIAGNDADINGTYTLTAVPPSSTVFTLPIKLGSSAPGTINSGTVTRNPASANSSTAVATVASHGFSNGQTVTIAGASPTAFNGSYGITVVDANTFSYNLTSPQGTATTPGTATVLSTTATATTSVAHGLAVGNTVTIAGANPSGYNGSFSVTAVPNANSFTYSLAGSLAANTSATVTATRGAGTTVTGTTTVAHLFPFPSNVTISGADTCYNGTYPLISAAGSTFTYATPTACPQNATTTGMTATSGAAFITTVTATLTNHGFASCTGGGVTIADGTVAAHNTLGLITVVDANTFTYTNPSALNVAPGGVYTARCAINPTAFANASGHGLGTNPGDIVSSVTIAGAAPAAYNGNVTATRIDADNFSYVPAAAPNAVQTATSGITASINTTTAIATSVNHGFSSGTTVAISGASPAAFNGSFSITSLGADQFSYTIASPQGDATGAILAASGGGSGSERDLIINWVRGQDNATDENANGSLTDCRASVHGDVLHSRPAVINYNRYGGDNDVYVFYGANDGIFRGMKGGTTTDGTDPTTLLPGQEAWGFVVPDSFTDLKRLRNNSPIIGSSFKKPYFMDGPISVHTVDGNNDGKLDAASGTDSVNLYVGARRGGRYIYSLDVTNPAAPRYRWKVSSNTAGFGELGQTWSQPVVVTGIAGYSNPVLIVGGGYDPNVEDIENCTISATTAASYTAGIYTPGTVTYNNGAVSFTSTGCTTSGGTSVTFSRTMGRAIYVIDAITGELVWSAARQGSGASLEVPGMDFAISADPLVVRNESGGSTNRAYFGDTGGNMWRFDFGSTDRADWTITRIASVSDISTPSARRKFLYPPDVVAQPGFDAVLIGSGDREHPFDVTVTNRFYMFKDRGNDAGPVTGTTYKAGEAPVVNATYPIITHSLLYDASLNCVQNPGVTGCSIPAACITACSAIADATERSTCEKSCAITSVKGEIAAKDGWYFSLGTGEKNIGNTVVLNGVVFFNTNQPSQTSDNCTSNLGIARQYQVAIADASAVKDMNLDTTLTASDRASEHAGGGYLPSPVHVVVEVDGNIYEGVISGTSVEQPPGTSLNTRTRRYWYKEVD